MSYQAFVIKYGEIGLKGKNRHLFEDALVHNITANLKNVDGEFRVDREQGRVYVEALSEFDYEGASEALKRVFGIVEICPAVLTEDNGFDQLSDEILSYLDETYSDKNFTFKVLAAAEVESASNQFFSRAKVISCEVSGSVMLPPFTAITASPLISSTETA